MCLSEFVGQEFTARMWKGAWVCMEIYWTDFEEPVHNYINWMERSIFLQEHIFALCTFSREWIFLCKEIDELLRHENIISFVKPLTLRWLSHIKRKEDKRVPKMILNTRMEGGRWKGRPKKIWMMLGTILQAWVWGTEEQKPGIQWNGKLLWGKPRFISDYNAAASDDDYYFSNKILKTFPKRRKNTQILLSPPVGLTLEHLV